MSDSDLTIELKETHRAGKALRRNWASGFGREIDRSLGRIFSESDSTSSSTQIGGITNSDAVVTFLSTFIIKSFESFWALFQVLALIVRKPAANNLA